MHLYNFYHGHQAHKLAFTDFWLYELSVWLHTLAQALISIFIPVLMLKTGYAISDIVFYYLALNVFDVPLNFLARELVRRFGARITIAMATLATIGFFYLFLHLTPHNWPILLLLAFAAAVYDSFYWVAHFFLFMNSSGSTKYAGRSTGIMYAVRQCALLVGPALGALVLIFFSQTALLWLTIVCLILSLIPLINVDEFPDKPETASLPFKQFFALPSGRRAFLSTAFYAIHDSVENTLFPVFIFILFGTIQSVAYIPIILSVAAIAIALFLGNLKEKRREPFIALGALAIALLWITRLFLGGTLVYYATVLMVGVCAYLIMVPLDSAIFEYGRKIGDPLSASTYRNTTYMASNVVLYSMLAILLNIFQPSFAIAAASLIALVLLNAIPALSRRSAIVPSGTHVKNNHGT